MIYGNAFTETGINFTERRINHIETSKDFKPLRTTRNKKTTNHPQTSTDLIKDQKSPKKYDPWREGWVY